MTVAARCPACGATLDTSATGGVCPACLLGLAVEHGTGRDWTTDDHPGAIGPYRIVRTLGEGGMGIVYLAEQTEPIHRRVALKVIKLGMDTRQVVARFETERQTLALMEHPHIASVFHAAATTDGRPYFVMEFVDGVPITEYCDQHRLPIEDRLRLFAEVCAAVHYAHQKGIIHRDLKPSNILVALDGGSAVPKIIDFGVAKATHQHVLQHSVYTEQGILVGTLEYMSPEQASLSPGLDTTTDVYSLGVLLYELLSGALPIDPAVLRAATYDEMRRLICDVEPPRPSAAVAALGDAGAAAAACRRTDVAALRRRLRGDLDWITLKALERDRRRRYGSASDLAADIDRSLNDELVAARPPSALYRSHKFVRRHRALVSVFAVVAAGFIVSTALYFNAQRARRAANLEAYGSTLVAAASALDQLRDAGGDAPADAGLTAASPADADSLLSSCTSFARQADVFVQTETSVPDPAGRRAAVQLNAKALAWYLRAKDDCVRALELRFPGIRSDLERDPSALDARLHSTRRSDVPLLYWTVAAWGPAIALALDRPGIVADLPAVRAIADRALALDESWSQGAIHETMIVIESVPASFGGSPERARAHFRRAVELQHGQFPGPYVDLAAGAALAEQNRTEFESLLRRAIALPPAGELGRRIASQLIQRRAVRLLGQVDQLFRR